jgi:hypothetical protein
MARRSGQLGYEEKKRGWYHVRFRMDVAGQEKRAYLSRPICPVSGPGSLTKPEDLRKRREIIAASGTDTEEHFNKLEAFNHGVTFRKQAEWWLNHAQTRIVFRPNGQLIFLLCKIQNPALLLYAATISSRWPCRTLSRSVVSPMSSTETAKFTP